MRLLSRMTGGKALFGIGVQHTRVRNPAFSQAVQSGPIGPTLLPATAPGPPPQPRHPVPESPQAVEIPRYRVVVEVALHDRPEPLARLRHRIMHAPSEL